MIKKVEMFTVVCDNCGTDVNKGQEYSCWNDETYAEEIAMESDWHRDNDKHYCTHCFSFDENDNIIIDESRTARSTA